MSKVEVAPAGSADVVVTFRNVHNWMGQGTNGRQVFASFYRALKPGGILGVEEHRAPNDKPQDPKAASGYVREDYTIALAERPDSSWSVAPSCWPIRRTPRIIRRACGRCRRHWRWAIRIAPSTRRSARPTTSCSSSRSRNETV